MRFMSSCRNISFESLSHSPSTALWIHIAQNAMVRKIKRSEQTWKSTNRSKNLTMKINIAIYDIDSLELLFLCNEQIMSLLAFATLKFCSCLSVLFATSHWHECSINSEFLQRHAHRGHCCAWHPNDKSPPAMQKCEEFGNSNYKNI